MSLLDSIIYLTYQVDWLFEFSIEAGNVWSV